MIHSQKYLFFGSLYFISLITAYPAWSADNSLWLDSKMICTNIELNWNKVADADNYRLWYRPPLSGDASWEYLELPKDSNTFSATLLDGARYEIQLEAFNAQNNRLGSSNFKRIQAGNYLLPPFLTITTDGSRGTASWNPVENAKSYVMYYNVNGKDDSIRFNADTLNTSFDSKGNAFTWGAVYAVDKDGFWSDYGAADEFFVGSEPEIVNTYQDLGFKNPAKVYAAQPTSQYAALLPDCLYSGTRSKPCTLAQLPLIGQDNPKLSVTAIMDRVVSSDAWMADRFRTILEHFPPEALMMFRAVTGIVIAGDINPSRYMRNTGAIYIDPTYLWLNEHEKATIHTEEDPRKDCAKNLKYKFFQDYLVDGHYLFVEATNSQSPSLEQVIRMNAVVLLHELTHANDAFPPKLHAGLPRHLTVREAALLNFNQSVSNQVKRLFPLHSATLKYLAAHKYRCKGATCNQIATTAQDVERELIGDTANSDYSYSTVYEDVAMIAEELLVRYFMNAEKVGYVRDKQGDEINTNAYWIRKGIIGDPKIKAKAKFILSQIYPELNLDTYFNNLPLPTVIASGTKTCDVVPCNLIAKKKGMVNRFQDLDLLPYQ